MKKYLGLGLTLSLLAACGNAPQQAELNDVPSAVTGQQDLSVLGVSSVQTAFSHSKLSSALKQLAASPVAAQALGGPSKMPISGGYVTIDAVASGNPAALLSKLQSLGLKYGSAYQQMVSGRLPVSALAQAGQLAELKFVRQSAARTNAYPVTGATGVLSQGDFAQRSDIARSTYGVTGKGIKVGVLSDSFDAATKALYGGPIATRAAQDIKNGDLPANGVQVIEEIAPEDRGSATDEGRAMTQIVHDVAPGADIAFATAYNGGEAGFANNIRRLANAGSRVIVDDVSYFAEPVYSDGLIAQAVDKVASQGVSYFSSAGNSADEAFETKWKSGGQLIYRNNGQVTYQGEMLNYAQNGTDTMRRVVIPPGGYTYTYLQWDDPFASATANGRGARTDLDILVMDANGNLIPPNPDAGIYSISNDDNIGHDPLEAVLIENNSEAPRTVNFVVTRYAGPAPTRVYMMEYGDASAQEYITHSPTVVGHHNARNGAAVAAARFYRTPAYGVNPALPESFTSLGGVPVLYDLNGNRVSQNRQQPRFTAPDGANTSFFAQITFGDGSLIDGDTYPNFFGTSAAAPHAAGAAALMLQAKPSLGPAEVIAALANTAADINTRGYDYLTGTGLIQADAAVGSVR
ncbi:peptidase S8 [Deinococcus irradiatisoli]|uniref:Peptidase S8 n=1 Tax=Deinococcus irradiatisoli TaxID=2202254 RepID=A0A2Z3JMW7_9DEIO|nr:S8 family serine peptidase [Deinococcus irradiatisoli]AWN24129.1 peptidase S8 [Deinococcus irradiatisoli]